MMTSRFYILWLSRIGNVLLFTGVLGFGLAAFNLVADALAFYVAFAIAIGIEALSLWLLSKIHAD